MESKLNKAISTVRMPTCLRLCCGRSHYRYVHLCFCWCLYVL